MTAATERYLVFDICGGFRYALPLAEVAEILEPVPTFPIPRAPHSFRGAINFHGRVVAVLDLATFLDAGTFAPDGRFIVLNRDQVGLALACGPSVNIVPAEAVLEEDPDDDPLIERLLILADGEVKLLCLEYLVRQLEELLHG
jgi:purine-binding chemotaxis protein CheW